jgi:hypothetical protein
VPDLTYLLPIRSATHHRAELATYLLEMGQMVPVIVVDGSPRPVFDAVHDDWSTFARHVHPASDIRGANGKVRGVLTGVRLVETEYVIIADDDVRYGADELAAMRAALDGADLVMPQNAFVPSVWHTVWDGARILLNRAIGGDMAGTIGVRTAFLAAGYDADVLFENLELIRTVDRRGGTCIARSDLVVPRRPPTTAHFLGQRTRQAYDEFARPPRLVVALLIVPFIAVATRRPAVLGVGAGGAIAVAEAGRRRHGGRRWFSPVSSLVAPLWLVERGVCSWIAVWRRCTGGVPYAGGRLVRATSDDWTILDRASGLIRSGRG